MGRRQAALGLVLVVSLLASATPAGAAAGDDPRRLPLDAEVTETATVQTGSETYVVYEYDNVLPYADGVEVYADGERVTSPAVADEVFQSLARRRATKFEPENRTIERLRRVVERTRAVRTASGDALAALNETLAYRETLQGTGVNDTNAWAVATERSPALEEYYVGNLVSSAKAEDLRERLLTVHRAAEDLRRNATRVVTLLEDRRAGEEINRSDLYRRYGAVYADLATIKEQIDVVRQSLPEVAEGSRTAAEQVGTLRPVGDELQGRLVGLAETLETADERLASAGPELVGLRDQLPAVATDRAYQAQLTERWRQRNSAAWKVYATAAEAVIAVLAGALALFEVRS